MRKRVPSLFSSIVRGYLWVILLLAVITPLVLLTTITSAFRERANQDLIRSARALVPSVESYLADSDFAGLDSLVKVTAPGMNTRITVIARDGRIYADSERDPEEMENHRARTEVIAAFNGIAGSSSRRSATMGREMLYSAVPVHAGDSITAVVRTSIFFDSHTSTVLPVIHEMIFIAAAALVLALLSAWLISGRISVPMSHLADVAERVSRGELDARAAPGNTREQNSLAVSINRTLEKNEKLISDLSRSNSRNSAILHSLSEGVAVVSSHSQIVLINGSFRDLFKMTEDGNDLPLEVKNIVLSNGEPPASGRLEYQGKMIAWTSAPVESSSDSVYSFSDITKEFRLSEMKRNFAVNVSHELRTPLTAIKGYSETLQDEVQGDASGYLQVILRNTDRLIALVEDIQILSEVESDSGFLSMETVSVQSIMQTVLPLFESRMQKKNLSLSFLQDKPDLKVNADRFRVEQILVNLIDNACKYTESGGIEVRVSSRGSFVVFAVSDTGRGIPEEHQERIFERFYVVDRSRSRKVGGTGLGLAISKHIVEAHGGIISVTSSPGQGSIFLFTLPRSS